MTKNPAELANDHGPQRPAARNHGLGENGAGKSTLVDHLWRPGCLANDHVDLVLPGECTTLHRGAQTGHRHGVASASRSCAACLQNPRLLIMDEPTSVLTPQEVERLFETLRRWPGRLRDPLHQPQAGGDPRAVRHGDDPARRPRWSPTCDPTPGDRRSAGRDDDRRGAASRPSTSRAAAPASRRWWSSGLSCQRRRSSASILRTSRFEVRAGEIFGIAGVAGNGQTELLRRCPARSGWPTSRTPSASTASPVGRLGPRARRAPRRRLRARRSAWATARCPISCADRRQRLSQRLRPARPDHQRLHPDPGARDAYAAR